jgi:CubicO group peptidase (beta-lactamase class C family)
VYASQGPTPAERQRLAHLAADFMDFYEVPELSVAIGSNGEPVYVEAFGFADRENQERLTPQHLFRIASVTKPITSELRVSDRVFGPDSLLGDEFTSSSPLIG